MSLVLQPDLPPSRAAGSGTSSRSTANYGCSCTQVDSRLRRFTLITLLIRKIVSHRTATCLDGALGTPEERRRLDGQLVLDYQLPREHVPEYQMVPLGASPPDTGVFARLLSASTGSASPISR